jgi:hypothetical protein
MINDLPSANNVYNQLRTRFHEDVVRKYPEIIELLMNKNREVTEKATKEREDKINASKKEEKTEEKDETSVSKKGMFPRWFHYLFSTTLLAGSSFMFYYFIKNRSRYMTN